MKEKLYEEVKEKAISTVIGVLLIILIVLIMLTIGHGMQINPDTIKVTPQDIIMGTELEELESIPLDSAYLIQSDEISLKSTVMNLGRNILASKYKQLKMIDNYIGLLEDIDSMTVKAQADFGELEIPAHAIYSGTRGLAIDKGMVENIYEFLGFNSLWFSSEMHIYAWHKEYELFNKTKKVENHYILIYNNAFIYLRIQHTNKTKQVIDLFGGKIAK